jgi:hypothetical protein
MNPAAIGHQETATVSAPSRPFWERVEALFAPFIAARQRAVQHRIDAYLATMEDYQLRDLGLNPNEVRARAGVRRDHMYL